MAKGIKILANRKVAEQSLFFPNHNTRMQFRKGMKGGNTKVSMDEALKGLDRAQEQAAKLNSQAGDIRKRMGAENLSRTDKVRLDRELSEIQQQGLALEGQMKNFETVIGGGDVYRDLTKMERLGMVGGAVRDYYIGGTAGQSAARIGATAGGIIGLNVGLDALNNRN